MSELRPIVSTQEKQSTKCIACAAKMRDAEQIVWKPVWGIANRTQLAPFCVSCASASSAAYSVDGSRIVIVDH